MHNLDTYLTAGGFLQRLWRHFHPTKNSFWFVSMLLFYTFGMCISDLFFSLFYSNIAFNMHKNFSPNAPLEQRNKTNDSCCFLIKVAELNWVMRFTPNNYLLPATTTTLSQHQRRNNFLFYYSGSTKLLVTGSVSMLHDGFQYGCAF